MAPPTRLTTSNSCPRPHPSVGAIRLSTGSFPGLRGWYRCDDVSGTVSTWPDASGYGNDLTLDPSASASPSVTTDTDGTLNSHGAVKFSSTRSNLIFPAVPGDPATDLIPECAEAGTLMVLHRRHGTLLAANGAPLMRPAGGFGGQNLATHWPRPASGFSRDISFRTNVVSMGNTTSTFNDAPYLVEVSSHASDGWKWRLDGVEQDLTTGTGVTGGVADQQWSQPSQLSVGGYEANGYFPHPAYYWEVMVWDSILTASERSTVHSHLNTKYGLSLPT